LKKKQEDGRRKARVEREVQACVASYLLTGYIKSELPGIVTIAAVRMPADFRSARVYVSVFGVNEDQKLAALKILERRASEIQRHLGVELKMRYCPVLKFYLDEETERILKIEKIIANFSPNSRAESESKSESVSV